MTVMPPMCMAPSVPAGGEAIEAEKKTMRFFFIFARLSKVPPPTGADGGLRLGEEATRVTGLVG